MRQSRFRVIAAVAAFAAFLAGCGGGSADDGGSADSPTDPKSVSGDITVLTHRTDLVQDKTFEKYKAEFNKLYPNVKVTVQGITSYEGDVKVRMNGSNYGDVLMIPGALARSDYPKYFAPLGDSATLAKKYRYTDFTTFKGKVYGITPNGNATGFVYNKAVWKQAGVTAPPTTPEEFITALKAIKPKTSSIPYYTNYHDAWPVGGWYGALGSATCDPDALTKLATDTDPWGAGKELNIIDSLLFDVVKEKLVEPDPTTTNWENSKNLIATGKIATMWLGSWAVTQMQDAAKKAGTNPDDIGIMSFPGQKDGKFCPISGPDYNQAVSLHSKHKAAARAWLDWFADKSGFAQSQGGIPVLREGQLPASLGDYATQGVEFIELKQDKGAVVNDVDKAGEVGLTTPDYRQHLVDVARGAAPGTLPDSFAELTKKWDEGLKTAGSR